MRQATDHNLRYNPELLRYKLLAVYAHILATSAHPLHYKPLAKRVRRLARLEDRPIAEVLAELRDAN